MTKTEETIDFDLDQPLLRRREVVAATGLDRGRIQGWEQQHFWEWPHKTSEKRLYSLGDVFRFAIAAEMELVGIPIRRTWDFIHATPKIIMSTVPYLAYVEIYRAGSGGSVDWHNCKSAEHARTVIERAAGALKQSDVRGLRSSIVNIQRIINRTMMTLTDEQLGRLEAPAEE